MRRLTLWLILFLIGTNILTLILMGGDDEDSLESQTPQQQIPTSDEDEEDKPVVARVDGRTIYHQDWLTYLEDHYGEAGLTEMINQQVIETLADQTDIKVNSGVVDLEMSFLATLKGEIPEDQVEKLEAEWRQEIEHRLLTEALFTKNVTIPEDEVRAYFDTYKSQYQFTPRIELSHIVVDDRATADRVYQELEEGADFKALAYEYTIDEESRPAGGYLGFYSTQTTMLLQTYFEQAKNLTEYSYSEPFIGNQGFVILYLHRELPEVNLDYDQVKDHIRIKLAIDELGETPSVKGLWNDFNINWIY